MKLREKIKRFCRLDVHNHEGFTLVELIIVIAILAILSSVAVVGYSSYVKKANMQADKALVAEIVNALTLHYYSAQPSGDFVATVVLTDTAVIAEGFALDALQAAYGSSWSSLKLKYNSWGNGAVVASNVLAFITGGEYDSALEGIYNGTLQPGYASEIDELYDMVEQTAVWVGGKLDQEGAELVDNAAGLTTSVNGKGADDFANVWSTLGQDFATDFFGVGDNYDAGAGSAADDLLPMLVACAGAVKARNVAMASYVRQDLTLLAQDEPNVTADKINAICNAIQNFTLTNSSVPCDIGGIVSDPTDPDNIKLFDVLTAACGDEGLAGYAVEVACPTYFTSANVRTDALGYYAMMSAIDATSGSTELTDDTYWEDMGSAIDVYKAALAGVDLNEMAAALSSVNGNSIAVVMYVQNGEITFVVSPQAAKAE